MKRLLFTFLIFWGSFCAGNLRGQQSKGAMRLEVPARFDLQRYHLVPLDKNGFLIFYESNEVNKEGKRKWYFGYFDTHMQQRWLRYLPLHDKLEFTDFKRHGNILLIFLKNVDKVRSDYGFYEVVKFDIKQEKFTQVTGTMPLGAELAGMDFYGTTACMALNLESGKADLLFLRLDNGDVTPFHFNSGYNTRIMLLTFDNRKKQFIGFAKIFEGKNFKRDINFRFNIGGKQILETEVTGTQPVRIIRDLVPAVFSDSLSLFFGTYDLATGSVYHLKDYLDEEDPHTAGFLSLTVKRDSIFSVKYFDFLSFKNIPGTFANRSYKMGHRPGKTMDVPAASLLFVLKPEVLAGNGQYLLYAEAYKPYYRTETRMDYDFYGRLYPYTYEIFDGYEFYDLIITGFSGNGKYIWDNDFQLEGLHSYLLQKHAMVDVSDRQIIAAYVHDGKIITQVMEGPTDVGKPEEIPIAPKFVRDRVIDSENGRMVHWYDHYYLVFGYQKLTNRTMKDQNYRSVFFVNKVAYQ